MISIIFLVSWIVLGLITVWIAESTKARFEDPLTFKQKLDIIYCSPLIWVSFITHKVIELINRYK